MHFDEGCNREIRWGHEEREEGASLGETAIVTKEVEQSGRGGGSGSDSSSSGGRAVGLERFWVEAEE